MVPPTYAGAVVVRPLGHDAAMALPSQLCAGVAPTQRQSATVVPPPYRYVVTVQPPRQRHHGAAKTTKRRHGAGSAAQRLPQRCTTVVL